MRVFCPKCRTEHDVPEDLVGTRVRCGNTDCQQTFTVPPTGKKSTGARTSGVPSPGRGDHASQVTVDSLGSAKSSALGPPTFSNGNPAASPSSHPVSFAPPDQGRTTGDARTMTVHQPTASIGTLQSRTADDLSRDTHELVRVPRRPAMLVWIVFLWGINGLASIAVGTILSYVATFVGGVERASRDLFGAHDVSVLAAEMLALFALLAFHFGLLMEVTCYGLWTFRRWALSLAKTVAGITAALSVIGVVVALITRQAIVVSLAGLFVNCGIWFYFVGSSNFSRRMQQLFARVRQAEGQAWDGYE